MSRVPPRDELTTRWRAAASPGGLIGILGIVLSLLIGIGALLAAVGMTEVELPVVLLWAATLAFTVLATALGYLVWAYFSIRYELGERTLVICWANQRHVIDLDAVKSIRPEVETTDQSSGRWQRFWPGYYVGTRRSSQRSIQVIATLPRRRQLLVDTVDRTFAISPERPVLFVEEYNRLQRMLAAQRSGSFPTLKPGEAAEQLAQAGWTMHFPVISPATAPAVEHAAPDAPAASRPAVGVPERQVSSAARPSLFGDSLAVGLLGLAVLLNVVMVSYILARYDSLPQRIVLHWSVNGSPDRIGSPREIWILPIITGLVTVANFGLAWSIVTFDRFAARFLLGGTCLVQIVAWVALLTLI